MGNRGDDAAQHPSAGLDDRHDSLPDHSDPRGDDHGTSHRHTQTYLPNYRNQQLLLPPTWDTQTLFDAAVAEAFAPRGTQSRRWLGDMSTRLTTDDDMIKFSFNDTASNDTQLDRIMKLATPSKQIHEERSALLRVTMHAASALVASNQTPRDAPTNPRQDYTHTSYITKT